MRRWVALACNAQEIGKRLKTLLVAQACPPQFLSAMYFDAGVRISTIRYVPVQVRRKGPMLAVSRHAICAATLSTLPFDIRHDDLEHRPRGVWWPFGTAALIAPGSQKKKKAAGEHDRIRCRFFKLACCRCLTACLRTDQEGVGREPPCARSGSLQSHDPYGRIFCHSSHGSKAEFIVHGIYP